MRLLHEGCIFSSSWKRNLAFLFPFLTVTENSGLCIHIQITKLRVTKWFSLCSLSLISGAVFWLFWWVCSFSAFTLWIFIHLWNNLSLLHFYWRLWVKLVLPLSLDGLWFTFKVLIGNAILLSLCGFYLYFVIFSFLGNIICLEFHCLELRFWKSNMSLHQRCSTLWEVWH